MVLTGTAGWLASFQLSLDDWRLLSDPACQPSCNISPVISCGSVMSSPRGSLLGFPNRLLKLGTFAAVTALGIAVLSGARLHRRLWLALDTGALVGVAFVHWLIGKSLYELNKICPYCAVIWVATICLFWYVTLHGIIRTGSVDLDLRLPGRRAAVIGTLRHNELVGWS